MPALPTATLLRGRHAGRGAWVGADAGGQEARKGTWPRGEGSCAVRRWSITVLPVTTPSTTDEGEMPAEEQAEARSVERASVTRRRMRSMAEGVLAAAMRPTTSGEMADCGFMQPSSARREPVRRS